MHAFLFAHIHWLWAILHWLRHAIYAPWTFLVVVFIGIAQTLIAWESGELAVKALTSDLLKEKDRKRYLRLVRTLALLLLPATIFVGVVNDRGQRESDERADRARRDQVATQGKLDKADARAARYDDSFDAFVKSLDPSKLTLAQYSKLIQAQRDASHAGVSAQAPPGPDKLLSLMSNDELKAAIADFQKRMQAKYGGFVGGYFDLQDSASKARGNMVEGRGNTLLDEQAIERYNEMMNSIVQTEIPQANLFIAEVNRRLGPQGGIEPPIPTAPAQTAAGLFVGKMRYFEERASKLP